MCELMTIAAAAVFTVLWALARRRGKPTGPLFTAMLMFWGAALMWSVDCVANRLEGEPLLDLGHEDTVLGCIIVAVGLVAYAGFSIFDRRPARAQYA
ncbi:MAG: hypothetical protein J5807_05215 [Kiritimatiellae bacterium]|nr:hypothetical protein [Kiritimatiellia bacterium]